jgi:hypothetical protein
VLKILTTAPDIAVPEALETLPEILTLWPKAIATSNRIAAAAFLMCISLLGVWYKMNGQLIFQCPRIRTF